MQWYQLQNLEDAYEFIFLSRELFPIVNSASKKSALATAAENLLWEKDKQVIVAILATIDSFHKAEVIKLQNFPCYVDAVAGVSWSTLSDECIIALQEK